MTLQQKQAEELSYDVMTNHTNTVITAEQAEANILDVLDVIR